MRCFVYGIGVAASMVLFATSDARALTTFDFAGTCGGSCGDFGAAVGDDISGSITLQDAAADANVIFGLASIVAFDMQFGSFSFDFPSAPTGFTSGSGTVNSSGSGLSQLLLRGGPTPDVFFKFPDIINTDDTWRIALCQLDCIGTSNVLAVAVGTGNWTTAIPEPSAALVFSVGFFVVASANRRSRRGSSQ